MAESISLEMIIVIVGVIGTWVGVYLGYRAIKKNNEKILTNITTMINSGNRTNTQVGKGNQNVQ
ncbi:MAG: hypothetical protein KKB88_04415 [Nanoarchaeota archaeon]|nr:hypothetical protein [Nanoarchaeota archaeon]